MKNIMDFDGGISAVISYDPDIEMFRGEFIGINGGADFYAGDVAALKTEGKKSLEVFLRMCEEDGVPPKKSPDNLALHLPPEVYQGAAVRAAAAGTSLNAFITEAVRQTL